MNIAVYVQNETELVYTVDYLVNTIGCKGNPDAWKQELEDAVTQTRTPCYIVTMKNPVKRAKSIQNYGPGVYFDHASATFESSCKVYNSLSELHKAKLKNIKPKRIKLNFTK